MTHESIDEQIERHRENCAISDVARELRAEIRALEAELSTLRATRDQMVEAAFREAWAKCTGARSADVVTAAWLDSAARRSLLAEKGVMDCQEGE